MPSDSERTECRTPTPGKQPTRIPSWKFDLLRRTILRVVPTRSPGLAFRDLPARVQQALPPDRRSEIGSIAWHVTTVKLELEVRGELRRVPGVTPQHLVRGRPS